MHSHEVIEFLNGLISRLENLKLEEFDMRLANDPCGCIKAHGLQHMNINPTIRSYGIDQELADKFGIKYDSQRIYPTESVQWYNIFCPEGWGDDINEKDLPAAIKMLKHYRDTGETDPLWLEKARKLNDDPHGNGMHWSSCGNPDCEICV